jgi:plasmid stabilization system protein ParE
VRLRYTPNALRDIDRAISYIDHQSPQGARNVAQRFHGILAFLQEHPDAGVSTGFKGTRRFFLKPYPYVVYFRVGKDELVILRLLHTSRKPKQPS